MFIPSGAILERFTKPRESTMFGNPVYLLDGPGPSISVSDPHEEFFNRDFALCIGWKHFSYGWCIPMRMHEVWKALLLRHIRVEQLSSLRQDVGMIRAIVVPGKHVMASLMLALKEAEVKALTIPVHINHFHKEKQHPKVIMKHPQWWCMWDRSTKPQH